MKTKNNLYNICSGMDYRGLNIACNKWYKKNKNLFTSENIVGKISDFIGAKPVKGRIEK